jgi:diketogulonate reductase-like aldo/keto reductase
MAPPPIPKLSAHGAEIPAIGFGTSSLGDCGEIVATALKLGYRHIDTAWKYGTERGVGEGISASGVPRRDIFLTTKVSHEYLRADDFARSVEQSLKNLGVDFVDLLLVHWPNPDIPLREPIPALAKAKRRGLARISASPISTSPCSMKPSASAPSRWSICRPSITPISTRRSSPKPAASAV